MTISDESIPGYQTRTTSDAKQNLIMQKSTGLFDKYALGFSTWNMISFRDSNYRNTVGLISSLYKILVWDCLWMKYPPLSDWTCLIGVQTNTEIQTQNRLDGHNRHEKRQNRTYQA